MNRIVCVAAFVVGLAVVGWVGAGYVGSSPLALGMTALIGAVYVTGAVELLRFHRATSALARALADIPENLSHPGEWLGRLPAALRNPVRLRIEGERVGLPGPAVTPYLVGLLVLLGMLGTFLGMVVTLNGAVIALEGTSDLQAIRAALAAPVKGLGVAFGTSVAGVAASAMLGLVLALCRRARLYAAQLLDTKIATVLRAFSLAHRRDETYKALQSQAQALPAVVDKLEAMMARMERQSRELEERLVGEQERFYRDAKGTYASLAEAVDTSLRESLTQSARLAGETIQPVVSATMAGIARETTALQERVAEAVTTQLDGIARRFDTSVATVADTWEAALASHQRSGEHVAQNLQEALAAFTETFEQRSAALHTRLADKVEAQLDGVSARFGDAVTTVNETWTATLARHEGASEALTGQMRESLEGFAETFAARSAAMQAELAAKDETRQAALTDSLEAMAASLRQAWQQAGARLDETARGVAASAQTQATGTIEEVSRLMQTAAEAPRAAAEVIGELRRELSASIARDNTLLAERGRIMETLGELLAAINHASREQREAIDALVASATTMLERAGERFTGSVEAQSAAMTEAAAQVTGGAVEVASLGEAFGHAVQLFGESNDKLMTTLARIEGALDKSMARSDEQLAYYVAQAREIIDLSIMSQRQVVEDLQASLAGEV